MGDSILFFGFCLHDFFVVGIFSLLFFSGHGALMGEIVLK